MTVIEALTKLVVGMSRLGDHLLKQKVAGIIVAGLAFAGGAGLASVLKYEATAEPAAATRPAPVAPARAEVSIRDTHAAGDAAAGRGRCSER